MAVDLEKLQHTLDQAARLSGVDRDRFMEAACAGDPDLRREVESLLDAMTAVNRKGFLERPAAAMASGAADAPGDHFDGYELLEVIGEGGFGTVYRARQEQPIRRDVALKIIKLGMDTRQVILRFEAERQALAILDHPNIAKVHDAGATESGRPYFVMELVRGVPITQYCDQHQLSVRQRLELFVPVCQAVQHAHQKGIIHRDIKPSNILVADQDGRAVAKVIDFGIAKATQSRLTERTMFTDQGQLVGTPNYMSPEQAGSSGDVTDVDTRSDIYSLGVLLYELLTGTTPIDAKALHAAAYDQMQLMIREHEPAKPSTRFNTMGDTIASVAAKRGVEPSQLSRTVRGELDWIVMRCLEKKRGDRYQSAGALATEVTRYLNHEPVDAGPPSRAYQLRKYLRRNKIPVSAAALIVVALAAVLVTALVGLRAARREAANTRAALLEADVQRHEAQDRAATADSIKDFVVSMITSVDPKEAQGKPVLVLDVLNNASESASEKLKDQPRIEADVRRVLGQTYVGLGEMEAATRELQLARELRSKSMPDDADASSWTADYAMAVFQSGDVAKAEPLMRDALEQSRKRRGADNLETLEIQANLGAIIATSGRAQDAEPIVRDAYERERKILSDDDPKVVNLLDMLAGCYYEQRRWDDALPLFKKTYECRKQKLGDDHPDTIDSLANIGVALAALHRLTDAEPYLRECVERRRRVLGPDHDRTLDSETNLVGTLDMLGRAPEAEPMARDLVERAVRLKGEDSRTTITAKNGLAGIFASEGKPLEAEKLWQEALVAARKTMGENHPQTIGFLSNLVKSMEDRDRDDLAEPVAKEMFERAPLAQISPKRTAQYAAVYGPILLRLKRYADAEVALRVTFDLLKKANMNESLEMRDTLEGLVEACAANHEPEAAETFRAALAALPTTEPTTKSATSAAATQSAR